MPVLVNSYHDACTFRTSSQTQEKFVSSGRHGGIHTFSHTQRNQTSYTFCCQGTCTKFHFSPKPIINMQNVIVNTSIYVYPYIYFRINLPDNNLNPQLNTYIYTCKHAYIVVPKLTLPDRTLTSCGHTLIILPWRRGS